MQYPRIVFTAVGLTFLSVLMTLFTGYHFYLISTNQTTNERYKRHSLSKLAPPLDSKSCYNQGLRRNVLDVLFPLGIGGVSNRTVAKLLRERVSNSVERNGAVSGGRKAHRRGVANRHSCKFWFKCVSYECNFTCKTAAGRLMALNVMRLMLDLLILLMCIKAVEDWL